MSGIQQMLLGAGGAAAPVVDMGDIGHSLRGRNATNCFLSRTFGAPTLQNTYTWSGWVKRGDLGRQQSLIATGSGGFDSLHFLPSDALGVQAASVTIFTSTQKFRDPTAWMHILMRQNASGMELFVNGVSIGTTASKSNQINSAIAHQMMSNAASYMINGCVARICFVDGQYLAPSDFAEANSEGTWITKSQAACKAIVDGPGNNNFMLDFDTGAALANLGNDFSDNNNDWTVGAGFSITLGADYDWMTDTPSNNHATLNPLISDDQAMTLAEGNMKVTFAGSSGRLRWVTQPMPTGKWYMEYTLAAATTVGQWTGMLPTANTINQNRNTGNTNLGDKSGEFGYGRVTSLYASNAAKYVQGAYSNNSTTLPVANDVIGLAFDADAAVLDVYLNGVKQAVDFGTIPVAEYFFGLSGSASGNAWWINCGQRPFSYTPPSGYLPLSAANLPDIPITMSGSFTGNANANGPFVWLGGVPETMTINGNAVTWGTHADKTAGGFKLRTAATTHNASGTNNFTVTLAGAKFKYANAQAN